MSAQSSDHCAHKYSMSKTPDAFHICRIWFCILHTRESGLSDYIPSVLVDYILCQAYWTLALRPNWNILGSLHRAEEDNPSYYSPKQNYGCLKNGSCPCTVETLLISPKFLLPQLIQQWTNSSFLLQYVMASEFWAPASPVGRISLLSLQHCCCWGSEETGNSLNVTGQGAGLLQARR